MTNLDIASTSVGPLGGLRVVDLTDDLGRFATKLLAEVGADVVRISSKGSPGRPMARPEWAARGGVADWWYDGAKTRTPLDLDRPTDRDEFCRLASLADIIIDTEPPGRLERLGLGYARLAEQRPSLIQVSLTPFGQDGPRAAWQTSDLVASALAGICSVTGDPDEPLAVWGRQGYNFGGFYAAIAALAARAAVRRGGPGQHIDVSLHESITGSIENIFMQWFYPDRLPLPALAQRQGSLHWLGAYVVYPARQGHLMVTPTPAADALLDWMTEDGVEGVEMLPRDIPTLLAEMPRLMGFIRQFVSRHDASDLWWEAQQRHVAFGEVQSIRQVAQNPQFAHRGFFQNVAGIEPSFAVPARSVRYGATPSAPPRPPAATQTAVDDVLTAWQRGEMAAASPTSGAVSWPDASAKPLAGLRIADFTWVLAGPFATRIMGDLGADVVKFQNEERASVVNKDDYPYFAVWNRSKRSATLNMKHTGALAVVRKIIEKSDVLIENYAAGVLDRWGLDYATVKSWNPRIIYVSMSGCGHDGPWTKVISYAPTVHALCGLTSLTNPAGRGDVGAGFSLNDHAAGFAAVLAVLAAVEARERTGVGQQIDMAQLEVGAYLLGPAFVDLAANDHEARAAGNIDGVADHVPNEIYRCADEEFLAVTARSDAEWASLCAAVGLTALADDPELRSEAGRVLRRVEIDAAMSTWARSVDAEAGAAILQGVGVPAGRVQNAADLAETDPQLAARGFWLQAETHLFGTRTHDRFPAKFSASALEPYEPSPYLGQHSFDVYGELAGMSDEEIAEGLGDGLFA